MPPKKRGRPATKGFNLPKKGLKMQIKKTKKEVTNKRKAKKYETTESEEDPSTSSL